MPLLTSQVQQLTDAIQGETDVRLIVDALRQAADDSLSRGRSIVYRTLADRLEPIYYDGPSDPVIDVPFAVNH